MARIRTLYAKLSVTLVVIVLTIGMVYAVLTLGATRHYLQATEQRLNRDLARDLVADRNLVEAGRINEPALKEMFRDYMLINPSIEIYLLDLGGRILSFSADPGVVKRKHVSLGPVRTFLTGDAVYPLLGDDPRSHDGQKAFSVTAVPSEEHPEGYLYVVLLGERVDSIAMLLRTSFIVRYSAFALIASIVVGALIGLVVLHAMTRRLRRLTNHIDRFRAEGFRTFEPFAAAGSDGGDEIAQLGRAYDEMAARIGEQIEALEKTDALRREMVAHVSHDLRTPLATLHGYIETLQLKDTELDRSERARYLAVALDQSERLRRLVGDLFELAKLDARQQTPEYESVALAELVNDIAQKFQLEAERHGSTIALDPDAELPMVDADIALIERVFENLIDNALSHSPIGAAIRISITLNRDGDGDAVQVQVADTGSGIAPEHLPRVFDRFYQADNAHRGNAHAGLGLAIAKRIVELHGARLEVESTLGCGTAFSFRLPVRAPAVPAIVQIGAGGA